MVPSVDLPAARSESHSLQHRIKLVRLKGDAESALLRLFCILVARTLVSVYPMPPEKSARSAPKNAVRADDQRPGHRWGKTGRAVLFVILALAAVQCARLGAAGLLVQLAQFEVDGWTSASRPPSRAEISRAAKYFSDSLEYASGNPWALEGLGALDLARMRASRSPREALDLTRDAHLRLRQALHQRPTSPFLWANLALTKLYLAEIDAEFLTALRHADELGPWEPSTQQTVLFVGLAAWQDLDPGLRQGLGRTLGRGASRMPEGIFKIVKSYRRFDLICAIQKYEVLAAPDCTKAAEAAKSGNSMK